MIMASGSPNSSGTVHLNVGRTDSAHQFQAGGVKSTKPDNIANAFYKRFRSLVNSSAVLVAPDVIMYRLITADSDSGDDDDVSDGSKQLRSTKSVELMAFLALLQRVALIFLPVTRVQFQR
jgi:hypothetical protein